MTFVTVDRALLCCAFSISVMLSGASKACAFGDDAFGQDLGAISALATQYKADNLFTDSQNLLLAGYHDGKNAQPVSIPDAALKLDNAGIVLPGIYRGGMPRGEKDYRALSDAGVTTLLNLRYLKTDADTPAYCSKYGLNCAQHRLMLTLPGSDYFLDWHIFKTAFKFVLDEQKAGHKIYIHCLHGSDRTGAMAAALVIRDQACGKQFDKDSLWKRVDADLKTHHFHMVYAHLYHEIKELVYDFDNNREWLCQK